jgi:hypothetical protein
VTGANTNGRPRAEAITNRKGVRIVNQPSRRSAARTALIFVLIEAGGIAMI